MAKNTSSLNFSLSLSLSDTDTDTYTWQSRKFHRQIVGMNEKEEDQRKTKILGKGSNQLSLYSKPQVHVQVPKEVISLGLTA